MGKSDIELIKNFTMVSNMELKLFENLVQKMLTHPTVGAIILGAWTGAWGPIPSRVGALGS